MKIVITGASGLLGWHMAARLHARNCAARFRGAPPPFDTVLLDRAGFWDDARARAALAGADAVLHCAGAIRADSDAALESENIAIARRLSDLCRASGPAPHIVYTNSIHAGSDTTYGRAKRGAGDILSAISPRYTDMILPHIFGEYARPYYNNVTATFIDRLVRGETPEVNPGGHVRLLHAGAAADMAIAAACDGAAGVLTPDARDLSVPDLLLRLQSFHDSYGENIFPDLSDPFDVALFNSYRTALYPGRFPRVLPVHADPRGTLFEAVKGEGGGQVFLSRTHPGIVRGDHFHLRKVERFLVLEGEAVIRIRRVLGGPLWEYRVSGDAPALVDMPTLHTHNIENTGDRPLLTLFWTNEIFDPADPDTYADPTVIPAAVPREQKTG